MRKNLKKKMSRLVLAAALISFAALSYQVLSQETEIRPVTVGQPMPNFTLPTYQGDNLSLSSLKGKNVLLVFPRGFAAQARWCTIDNYYYADLVDLEKNEQVRKKYNAEIIYVFPYTKEVVKEWVESNPDQLEKIESWKNPAEPEKLDEQGKARMESRRKSFPKSLKMKKGEVPTPFPILIDADRKVSNGLGIFSTEWGGSKVDQCISSVFILDKNGILQFKYIGQNTMDRPSSEYLMKTLERINKGE
jgi:peroxiredoxin